MKSLHSSETVQGFLWLDVKSKLDVNSGRTLINNI